MVPEDLHDFFVATASAAGALVGLLFVALSVWRERDEERHLVESHALRAAAALTVFTNALAVSLFALIPEDGIGETTVILATIGLVFVLASGLRLWRLRQDGLRLRARDLVFLAGATALFAFEWLAGLRTWIHPHVADHVDGIAEIVAFSLMFGIARSWELIGGPQVGIAGEMTALLRHPGADDAAPAPSTESPPEPVASPPEAEQGGA